MTKIKAYLETFKKYSYLLENLVSRDFKVKYRRSFLGVLWSMLNPILMMLVLNAVFSRIFRYNIENFPLYLISGQLLFAFFQSATSEANYSVIGASSLMKKVYIPKYLFPMEKMLFEFVNFILSLSALVVMMIIFRVQFKVSMLLGFVPLILLLIFTLGIGMILATYCVFFRDLKHLYSVVLTAWMYLTPIIYPMDLLDGFIHKIIMINPLTWYILYFRTVVLYGEFPTAQMNYVCIGYAVAAFVIGILVFKKRQDKFILYV